MRKSTLPRHARTGVTAVGWRKPRPGEDPGRMYPIWPILGGAEDDDEDDEEDDEGSGKSRKSTSKKSTKSSSGKDDDEDDDSDEDDDGKDWKAEAEKWRNLSRKHEKRARDNAGAAKERDRLKREGMSDVEKRVDEAVAAARAEERVKSGERVARSAFLAAAKGRIKKPADVVEDINLKKYVDEDGEVDDAAISELVDRIAPKRSDTDEHEDDRDDDERGTRRRRRGGFDQGARGSGRGKSKRGSVDGDELFEELLGRKPQTAQS